MLDSLGDRIRQIRKKMNLSQQEFADLLGVKSKAGINNFEKGRRNPPYDVLINIARLGHVTVDWLLTGKQMDNVELRAELEKKEETIRVLKEKNTKLSTEITQLNKIAEAANDYKKLKKRGVMDRWSLPNDSEGGENEG